MFDGSFCYKLTQISTQLSQGLRGQQDFLEWGENKSLSTDLLQRASEAVVEDVEESEGGVLYVDLLLRREKFTVVDERE